MRVHEISSIGKVTLDAFSFYVIIGEMEKAISIVIFSASQRRCSTFIFTSKSQARVLNSEEETLKTPLLPLDCPED